jgi:putative Ca2+/H+ antiporter (TMEM165/GDT1 family)
MPWSGGRAAGLPPLVLLPAPDSASPLEAFLVSTGIVALSELGDKTQLLAMVLAARFRRPVPIILAILVATLANHTLAGLAGAWLGSIGGDWMRWIVAAAFAAMAVWVLIPDKLDERSDSAAPRRNAFLTTLVCFFLAEIGDKTQIATVALAARFGALLPVVAGTTLGMLIADVPAVLLGKACVGHRAGKWVRYGTAAMFLLLAGLAASGVELGLF